VNKSYERLLAETIEAQNISATAGGVGGSAAYQYQQYYGVAPTAKIQSSKH
jgi:hypothetical protein